MTVDVAVVGGGVSGLATAFELARRGHRVVVLERQVRTGGNAVSERLGGFLMEHGPSTLNASSSAAMRCSLALGLEARRCELGAAVRRRYLVRDGRLHGIALHPLAFLASDYLSLGGRLRILAEPFARPSSGDGEESVASFFRRRFGSEFTERVVDPLVGGLFAGLAGELSIEAAFPRLVEMERRYGSITRALVRRRARGERMPGSRLFSWREGVATLPAALAARLGNSVRTGVAVRRVVRRGRGFRVEAAPFGAIEARAVVIATQPHVAAQLLEPIDAAAAAAAAAIEAPPLAVVFLGYRTAQLDHPLDGVGYLTPSGESRGVTATLFCSTMFAGRAPEGHVALAAYVGGRRAPELALLPPPALVALAREELGELVGARGEPVVARVRQWPRGLPQLSLGHRRRAAAIGEAEDGAPGLFVTGNYFSGVSVSSCLEQALRAAAGAHAFLRRSQAGWRRTSAARDW